MLQQLSNHINRHSLCKTTDKILLAVSGGIDSMVMLHLMRQAGFSIGVVHCNFQLRGEASMGDEAFVRDLTDRFSLPFFVKRFDTTDYATDRGISVQMAAAELRYSYFEELLTTHGYDHLATAHHFNDTIESVLLNLIRGTGIDGMRGILPQKGNVIRPMLFATRAMIVEYALQENIVWREDASNQTDDYQRNFIRHQIIPKFTEMNPAFEENFRDTHERLIGAGTFAGAYMEGFRSSAMKVQQHQVNLDIRKLKQTESPAVLLWELIKPMGFRFEQCKKIVLDHQPGKVFLSESHQLVVDRTQYIIEKKHSRGFLTQVIDEGVRSLGHAPIELAINEIPAGEFVLAKDASRAQLDADRLKFPLIWRQWQAGDYFIPLGMDQEKKLSDFLIDLKIPFNSKADITVVESAGDIVWVVGYRINERYKVTSDTRRILVIEQKPFAG